MFFSIVPFVVLGPAAQAGTSAEGSYSSSKTLARTFINADGSVTNVDSRNVTVNVNQTTSLRGRQDVNVTWSGAHPTGRVTGDFNATGAADQEYPVAVLECRNTSASDVDPTTCWTHGWQVRFQQNYSSSFTGSWRVDRYASAGQREPDVGKPAPEPASCLGLDGPTQYWVPFVAESGTSYGYGATGCAGLPPEDYTVDQTTASVPSNATFATTDPDGTGNAQFDISTDAENSSLGCSETVACSLVVIPIMGISCDGAYAGMPAEDVPSADDSATVQADCRSTGNYVPGQLATSEQAALSVSGYLWWSASNWRNRFVVPLTFAPAANVCDVISSGAPVDIYGSELMTEAAIQWAPAFCLDPKLFKFNHVQTAEPLARTLLADGSITAAFSAQAPSGGPTDFGAPTVQAPVAVTGFSISYRIDNSQGNPVTNLRLNARLLAKLLTESYSQSNFMRAEYTALANNPETITADPEFVALNPGIASDNTDPAQAAMIALDSNSDVISALTSYINADPEARSWLDGKADPWGMVVNPNYKGISLPVNTWPLLDTFVPDISLPCLTAAPTPWLPQVASPVATLSAATLDVQFAVDWPKVQCVTTDAGAAGFVSQWASGSRQPIGQRFVIGVTTAGEAERYDTPSAALETQSSVSATAQFTDGSGRTFVQPTQDSMTTAARLFQPDAASGVWTVPYDTMRTASSGAQAYPGTLVVYADVPTSGLPTELAGQLSNFLTFAAGAGQVAGYGNGQLPPGYVPMTAAAGLSKLTAYTTEAAADVLAQNGLVPGTTLQTATTSSSAATSGGYAYSTTTLPVASRTAKSSSAAASTVASSAAAFSSPASSSPAPVRVRTVAVNSTISGAALPILLAIAVLGGLVSAASQIRPRGRGTP